MNPLWFGVPFLIGAMTPVVLQMSTQMARRIGVMESAVVLHIVGTLAGLVWLAVGLRGAGFDRLPDVPWWAWLGGVLGVSSLALVNRALPETGVAAFVGLSLTAQLTVALMMDRSGWLGADIRPVGTSHLVGGVLLVIGGILISR